MPHTTAPAPHLLIVDDDPGTVRLLIEVLKDIATIEFATNGRDALDRVRQAPPDLVLLDIEMPGMDGFEVCRTLRRDPRSAEVPIVFLTVRDDVDSEVRAIECGGMDFITKPPHAPVVKLRVRNCLTIKRRTEQLRQLAVTDELTGLANRRAFDAALAREWYRAFRAGSPLSLLMLDIDHFKSFNDTHGHPAGDECLRRVAAALADNARRPGDVVARFGGEEFVLLLPACRGEEAAALAQSLRAAIAATPIAHPQTGAELHVTASIGVACAVPPSGAMSVHRAGAAQHPDWARGAEALLAVADDALYTAKGAGRDTVRLGRAIATPQPTEANR